MNALSIAIAWGALAVAAFAALSATALTRTHADLEGASSSRGEGGPTGIRLGREDVEDLILPAGATFAARSSHARGHARTHAHTHWPAPAHTNALLRSSPSVAHMSASPGRPGPIQLS